MKKSTQQKRLTQYHYNKLIKLTFVKCLVTKESQFSVFRKQLKKQKQLFRACDQIMQLNNNLVALLNTKSTVKDEQEVDREYTSICSSLAKLGGTSIGTIKALHIRLTKLQSTVYIRNFQDRRPTISVEALYNMENIGQEFKELYTMMTSFLSQVLKFKTGKVIDQTAEHDGEKTTPLLVAIDYGDLPLVESLVKNGANPAFKPVGATHSPLDLSVGTLNAELVQYFIAQNTWQYEFVMIFYQTVLSKELPVTKILTENGFRLNINVENQKNAICASLLGNTVEFNEVALQAVDFTQLTADQKIDILKMVAGSENPGILPLLKEQGIDINTADNRGYTVLFHITTFVYDRRLAITNLHKNGADIEHAATSGSTPIVFASQYGEANAIRTLMGLGANIERRNLVGADTLLQVIDNRLEDLALELIEAGAPVDRRYEQGLVTLLHFATQRGLAHVSRCLLEHGLDPKLIGLFDITYLHASITGGSVELVKMFLDAGVDIDAMNDSGLCPLAYACREGQSEIASLLIERGANTTLSTPFGVCILDISLRYCDITVPEAIIKTQNQDINTPNNIGANTVYCAAYLLKNLDDFTRLFKGKTIRIDIEKAYSPLVISIVEDKDDQAKWLIKNAIGDLNHVCRSRYTALFAAIFKANSEIVALLIEHGATLFAVNDACHTPLMQAAHEGYDEIVECLLEAGADPNTATTGFSTLGDRKITHLLIGSSELFSDEQKICALDLAARNGYESVVDLLLKKGAKSLSNDTKIKSFITKRNKHLFPSDEKVKPEPSLTKKITDKVRALLKNVPEKDIKLIADRIDSYDIGVINNHCKNYKVDRNDIIRKILTLVINLRKENIASRNMPNTKKLNKATLSTLKGIHAKLERITTGTDNLTFDHLPSVEFEKDDQAKKIMTATSTYFKTYTLKDFPNMIKIRRSMNYYIIPCIDLMTDGDEMEFGDAFKCELIAPKIARKTGSGMKGIDNRYCTVKINGKIHKMSIEFEIKITASDDRILCYSLKPQDDGPIILIPAVHKLHGLHPEKDKDESQVFQAPPLADFLQAARESFTSVEPITALNNAN